MSRVHAGPSRAIRGRLFGTPLSALGLCASVALCSPPRVCAQAEDAPEAAAEPIPAASGPEEDRSTPDESGLSRECTTQDVLRGLCSAEEAAQNAAKKPFRLMGQITLQWPVVVDPTPENDALLSYYLGGEIDLPYAGLYATAWVGVLQRFWRFRGQAQADLEDPFVGVGHRSSLSLSDAHSLMMVHRASLFFPWSRPSRLNLYYTMLDWVSAFRLPIYGGLLTGFDVRAQVRFHRHAEQVSDFIANDDRTPDPSASNTRANLAGNALLQQMLLNTAKYGSLIAQGTLGYRHQLRYDGSGVPGWSWSLGLTYTPVAFVSVTAAMEHGISALNRSGVIRAVAFDRDETAWTLTLFGRY